MCPLDELAARAGGSLLLNPPQKNASNVYSFVALLYLNERIITACFDRSKAKDG